MLPALESPPSWPRTTTTSATIVLELVDGLYCRKLILVYEKASDKRCAAGYACTTMNQDFGCFFGQDLPQKERKKEKIKGGGFFPWPNTPATLAAKDAPCG